MNGCQPKGRNGRVEKRQRISPLYLPTISTLASVTLKETRAQWRTCQASKKRVQGRKPPPLNGRAHRLPLPPKPAPSQLSVHTFVLRNKALADTHPHTSFPKNTPNFKHFSQSCQIAGNLTCEVHPCLLAAIQCWIWEMWDDESDSQYFITWSFSDLFTQSSLGLFFPSHS